MNWKCMFGRHDWQYNGFTARFEPYGDVFFISERLCVECKKRQEIYGIQVRSKQFNTWLKLPGKSTIFGETSNPLYNPQSSEMRAVEAGLSEEAQRLLGYPECDIQSSTSTTKRDE